jgi:ribosomal protein S18 acetylase RimI-like enzyme
MDATLKAMAADQLAEYLEVTFDDYVAEQVKSGRTPEEARANAEENRARAFAGNSPINGNEVFTVQLGEQRIGVLWIGPRDGAGAWWIFDVELEPEFRGRGLGRATMLLAENAVRERGGTTLGLNVFAHNTTARSLYESLGYEPMSMQLRKAL